VQESFRYGIVEDGFSTLKRDGWAQGVTLHVPVSSATGNRHDDFASFGMLSPYAQPYYDSGCRNSGSPTSCFTPCEVSDERARHLRYENGTELHLTLDLEQGTLTTGSVLHNDQP